MKFFAAVTRRFAWLNLPGALLCALLQRTPAVPVASLAIEGALAAPLGAVVRSAIVAASLGAVHSLAGATQLIVSATSVNATVGAAITPVIFLTKNAPSVAGSYTVRGTLPPGLTLPGLNAGGIINNLSLSTDQETISGTPTTAGTFAITIQAWELSNANGGFSVPVTVTFTISASGATGPPKITAQPVNVVSAVGETATFSVGVTANPAAAYQWKKNGFAVAGATSSTLSLGNLTPADAGNYSVDVTNSFGTVTSAAATLAVNATSSAPLFTLQPASQTIAAGATVVFTVAANGAPTPVYQWYRGTTPITGATDATLMLTGASVIAGNYTVTATNNQNSITSSVAKLTVATSANPGHLNNLSVLTNLTATETSFTVATVIGPPGISGNKPLLVRAAGPSLGQPPFNIPNALPDPKLAMFQGSSTFATNDNWNDESGIATVFARVGAFPFTSTKSLDAAHYSDPTPAGSYSVQVSGAAGQTGAVIAEIYDAGVFTTNAPRLVNVSVLKIIPASGLLTAGFTIAGDTALTVLVRAVGPVLGLPVTQGGFGLSGVLADPQLTLFNSASVAIASNDNWGGAPALTAAMNATGAFPVADTASKDALLLVTLPPGGYTAQVSGVGGTSGLAIVEVYEVR
jgi:hypothetical protein